jgi:putative ABC transport system permease protein
MRKRGWRSLPRIGRPDVDADVRAEIESHLEMQAQELMDAGYTPERARWEAARRFGDRDGVEREVLQIDRAKEREVRLNQYLEDLLLDARQAARQLRRQPLFALVAVLVMSLGIGANAAVFAVVDGALLRPLPMRNGGELVYQFEGATPDNTSHLTVAEFRAYERAGTFQQGVVGAYSTGFTVHGDADPELVIGGVLTGDPENVFGLEPLAGRWFTREEVSTGARAVLLDEAFWHSHFGGRTDVLGRALRINDDTYTVVGVLPHIANLLSPGSEVALWTTLREEPWMAGEIHFLRTLGRLGPGVTLGEAKARAASVARVLLEQDVVHDSVQLIPARTQLVGDVRNLLLLVFGAVLLLLLIVCANLANLFLARALERTREFAVRSSLGAGGARLLRQVMTEGMVLGVVGGAAGLLLSHAFIGVIRGLSQRAGALAPLSSVDARVVLFTLALSLLVGLLFSLWPALRAGRMDMAGAIRDGDTRATLGRGVWHRRRALVAVEVGLCVLLLTGAGLLVRSMWHVLRENGGFETDRVLVTGLALRGARYDDDATRARTFEAFLQRVHSLPDVVAVGYGSNVPLDGGDTTGSFGIEGTDYPADQQPYAKKRVVSPGYFAALGIPLLRGRNFEPRDRTGQPEVALISQAAATRYFGGEDPIGRRISFNWGPGEAQTVIGIVGDVKHDGLDRPIEPIIYRPASQFPQRGFSLVVRTTGEPLALLGALRRELHATDPTQALFQPRTMDLLAHDSLATRRTFMTLMLGFALVALVLTCVGVYAICAQSVAARTRELGVRMALGASPAAVVGQVIRRELGALGLGLSIGLPSALLAARALSATLYGVSPRDPLTFAVAFGALLLAGVLATVLPARRVAAMDVMNTLRSQ